jgi:hypothetical protein
MYAQKIEKTIWAFFFLISLFAVSSLFQIIFEKYWNQLYLKN